MAVSTSKQKITYIVTAHPDDEYAAWALIHRSSSNYPVFCVLTRGEQTDRCPGPNIQAGENGYGFPYGALAANKGSDCASVRINSFTSFLTGMTGSGSGSDSYLANPTVGAQISGARSGVSGYGTVSNRGYLLYAHSKCAALFFDLGDGTLEENEVLWALASARAARAAGELPNLPEYAIICGAYYWTDAANSNVNGSRYYYHRDHASVSKAIYNNAIIPGAYRWGATADLDTRPGRTDPISRYVHERAFVRNPSGASIGVLQREYGWLSDPSYWAFGHFIKDGGGTTYTQRFWQRT